MADVGDGTARAERVRVSASRDVLPIRRSSAQRQSPEVIREPAASLRESAQKVREM